MLSGNVASYSWSTLEDSTLRGTICVIQTASGFRPATAADFGSSLSTSGITLNMGAEVGITGRDGTPMDVRTVSGFNAIPVFIVSGGAGGGGGGSSSLTPVVPVDQATYSFPLISGSTFSNYIGSVPNINGIVSVSVEPDSANSDPIYYAFSPAATTGTAWEIRGDRTFEVSGTTAVYFGAITSTDRVRVHYSKY